MDTISVTKRNGSQEPFNIDKIHRIIEWAIQDLNGVSLSDVEINAKLSIKQGVSSRDIHEVLIESAANLISLKAPNYQYVAGRLLNYQLRKDVWGGKNAPKLLEFIRHGIKTTKVYEPALLEWYSEAEINKLDETIAHDRDFDFTYAGIRQLCDKYLLQNRVTKQVYETPQFAYMLIAMTLFHRYPKEKRLEYVKRAYGYFSRHKINLPTPIMAGVRTTMRSFASCCLVDVGDSMDSIFASVSAVGHATAKRYGIGINMGRMRAINTPIRGGDVVHTGVIPFLKVFESTAKSCQQGGLRGGGGTVTFPIWHYEIEDILQLKNNAGTDENRVRKLDYSISFSRLFYDRFINDQEITLFSPHEVPELYAAFGLPEFDDLYVKAEKNRNIKYRKTVSAQKLFSLKTKEHIETGRIYTLNIDHANQHSPWLDKVDMGNLCQEVLHPTVPLQSLDDPSGEIGVCILAAINWLEIQSEAEMEKVCDVIVRMLDELIDYQEYFAPAAHSFASQRRSLGVGVTNLAAFLAKHEMAYSDRKAPNLVDEWMERQQYYLLLASSTLAREKGACAKFGRTKYSQGIFPQDTYKKEVDAVVTRKPSMDWEGLKALVAKHGLRHSTLTAHMPVESSSVIQNATNGIEPPRGLLSYKGSKARRVPFLVPHADKWRNRYTFAFDMKDNTGYLHIVAALQKWTDMAISVNLYYNYPLDDTQVIRDTLLHYKLGGKTIYYINTNDGNKQDVVEVTEETKRVDVSASEEESGCLGGACVL
jgi:ribonucleoside-diphosphate reductase alpha chain